MTERTHVSMAATASALLPASMFFARRITSRFSLLPFMIVHLQYHIPFPLDLGSGEECLRLVFQVHSLTS